MFSLEAFFGTGGGGDTRDGTVDAVVVGTGGVKTENIKQTNKKPPESTLLVIEGVCALGGRGKLNIHWPG